MSSLGKLNKGLHTFKDAMGRVWDLGITMIESRRLDAADLSLVFQGPGKFSLLNNPQASLEAVFSSDGVCFAVIWVLVQPQLCKYPVPFSAEDLPPEYATPENLSKLADLGGSRFREMTEDDFCAGIDGDALAAGRAALEAALLDFFPRNRTDLSRYLRTRTAVQEEAGTQLEAMEPEVREAVKDLMGAALQGWREKIRGLKTQLRSPETPPLEMTTNPQVMTLPEGVSSSGPETTTPTTNPPK